MSSEKITEKISKIAEEPAVVGVVVRVNSPGGAVAPSQEIYQEILKLRESKPVYASLGTTAASGGYYIAAACEKIYTNPGTLTGSIGVIMNFINLEKVYEFLKMKRGVIKSGKFKDIGSEYRSMKPEEKKVLQNINKDIFDQFIGHVKATRKLSKKTIKTVSDARIMTGKQAKEFGLVDEIGTLNDAITAVATAANIEGKPNIVYPLRQKEKLIDYILQNSISKISGALSSILANSQVLLLPQNLLEVRYENR
jgi:protease-4